MSGAETARLFFAVALPGWARELLARALEDLRAAAPETVRWADADHAHLTLKFLGDVELERVPQLVERAQAKLGPVEAFPSTLIGLGAFPHARAARVLWLGVREGGRELAQLARRLDAAATRVGVPRERRPYQAHLTLGRLRSPARIALSELPAPDEIAFSVEDVILYESRLSPGGARYIPIAHLPLLRAGDAEVQIAPDI